MLLLIIICYICLAYTPGWNDPPSYSFEDTVSAQQENRPKIFDRIPARVLSNTQQVTQSSLENDRTSLDNTSLNENRDDATNNPAVSSSTLCDIPEEERLSYVMASLKDSIQNSTLPEVSDVPNCLYFCFQM